MEDKNNENIEPQEATSPLLLNVPATENNENIEQEEATPPLLLDLPSTENKSNENIEQEEASPLLLDVPITEHTENIEQKEASPLLLDVPDADFIRKPKKKGKIYRFFRFLLVLFILGAVSGGISAYLLYQWAIKDLPSFSKIADYRPSQATTVLARDGTLIGQFYREKRYVISFEEMVPYVPLAFLAVEDSEFYNHPGINIIAIFRAFLANVQSGSISQGGSTITQQVVKRLMLTPEKSYERKLKEAILAYKLEKQLSKDEILTIYLNQIFLGSNAYGVQAAANTYFGKNADSLSIAEAAMLAGLPQSPSANNPYRHPRAAKERQEHVLRRMRTLGWISDQEFDKAYYEELAYKTKSTYMGREGGWYLEEVRRQLIDLFSKENSEIFGFDFDIYGEDVIYEMGLTIHTSMDPIQQYAADKALRHGLESATKRHGWAGPIKAITMSDLDAYFEENPFTLKNLTEGKWDKAVVTGVNKFRANVRLGEYKGSIPLSAMRWARQPDKKLNGFLMAWSVKDARNVLKVGDVVWVSFNPPTQKEIDKIEKLNPKKLETLITEIGQIKKDSIIPLALEQYPDIQGAIISMEAKTGDVVALVGGYEFGYYASQFNRATQAKRQPGSAFKPVVYSAALDNGFTANSTIMDAPILIIDPDTKEVWRPKNFEGASFEGPITLNRAFARSRNLCTIRIAQEMGIQAVIDRALKLGFSEEFPPILSLSLGTVVVSPMEFTSAYTAFANGGRKAKPRFIQKIEGTWGNTIYESPPSHQQTITPQNAYVMAKLLQDVVQIGTARKAKVLEKKVGGKTGTTNKEIDAWFVGITPYLVSTIFIGYDQIEPMGRGETGSNAALPIYIEYAEEALEHYPDNDFPVPRGIYFETIDDIKYPFIRGHGKGINILEDETPTQKGNNTQKQAEDLFMQGL